MAEHCACLCGRSTTSLYIETDVFRNAYTLYLLPYWYLYFFCWRKSQGRSVHQPEFLSLHYLSLTQQAIQQGELHYPPPHLSKPKYAWCHVWLDPESNIHDTETNVSHRPSTIKGKANLLSNIKGLPHNVSSILTITYSFLALQAEYWPSLFSKKHFLMLHLS